jgi:hypothetical protein
LLVENFSHGISRETNTKTIITVKHRDNIDTKRTVITEIIIKTQPQRRIARMQRRNYNPDSRILSTPITGTISAINFNPTQRISR